MSYEKPMISDYGTLVELTAGLDHSFDSIDAQGRDGKTPIS
jgi:hypothetical protein